MNSVIKLLKLVAEKSATTFGDLPDCLCVFDVWFYEQSNAVPSSPNGDPARERGV